MADVTNEFFDIQRAVAHLDLGLKAYFAAEEDRVDAARLLTAIDTELERLISTAESARAKIQHDLNTPAASVE